MRGRVVLFQAEDGIRDLVRSRGLGDVYKRQGTNIRIGNGLNTSDNVVFHGPLQVGDGLTIEDNACLLYTSDAADERSSVGLGGRRIIKKKTSPGAEQARLAVHKNTTHVGVTLHHECDNSGNRRRLIQQ